MDSSRDGIGFTPFAYTRFKGPTTLSLRKGGTSRRVCGQSARDGECRPSFKITVSVRNKGDRDGSHSVLLMVRLPGAGVKEGHPLRQLVDY